ncbi:hypothetical protein LSCM1_06199 [Leishmania martiniquensis]|uniref:t-SNARE coiled-coil homology domain-containing protein n=1 Tax=Leishmania martiniquensis TaxID=1580590 RepID=A0A836GSF3_9TRYP|nr:hypothetical protein LSCM1_06199 [Leishmania martiniquensis]
MPVESGEVLSRSVQQLAKACSDVQNSTKELWTGRDAIARDRLRRARLLVEECHARVERIDNDQEPSLELLRQQYAQKKAMFELINAEATRRELQAFRQVDTATVREDSVDAPESQAVLHEVLRLDMSKFHTEEAIQREKLQSAREIESAVMDLKATYQEFHALVHQQQEGLDHVTNNVAESCSLVERGHDQIHASSRQQRSLRKIGCISSAVVLFIVVVAIIVVLALTR